LCSARQQFFIWAESSQAAAETFFFAESICDICDGGHKNVPQFQQKPSAATLLQKELLSPQQSQPFSQNNFSAEAQRAQRKSQIWLAMVVLYHW
jgi:hypothetical protein